jgi:hypothetical protein
MTVRDLVYQTLAADSALAALGFADENIYANAAPDSPPETESGVWMVLNWGEELPGVTGQRGRTRTTVRALTMWLYDRQRDYGTINSGLKRLLDIMEALEQASTGAGMLTCATWQGDGVDGYDDVYQAVYRTSTYTIVANGD